MPVPADPCPDRSTALEALLAVCGRLPASMSTVVRAELVDAIRNAEHALGLVQGTARSAWRAGYESGLSEGRKAASTERMLGVYRVFDPRPLDAAVSLLDAQDPLHRPARLEQVLQAARDILDAAQLSPPGYPEVDGEETSP